MLKFFLKSHYSVACFEQEITAGEFQLCRILCLRRWRCEKFLCRKKTTIIYICNGELGTLTSLFNFFGSFFLVEYMLSLSETLSSVPSQLTYNIA